MNDQNFITWQLLALGCVGVLNVIITALIAFVLKNILKLNKSKQELSSRVSHIEGHLEMRDEGAFRRLQTEE